MSMTFSFELNPFGDHSNAIEFGVIQVHSSGDTHHYVVEVKTKDGWDLVAHGNVPKVMPDGTRRSGHRNFLHLLRDILNDMDLEKLGTDYVNVFEEVKAVCPNVPRTADYPNDGVER